MNAGSISQQFVVSEAKIPPAPKPRVTSPDPWRCLASVQSWIKGFPTGLGRAGNVPVNLEYPKVGAAILLNEGPAGHIGEITDVDVMPSYVLITFKECNFIPGRCGYRTIRSDDPKIRGYHEVRLLATLEVRSGSLSTETVIGTP